LYNITIEDEIWCFLYDPQPKCHGIWFFLYDPQPKYHLSPWKQKFHLDKSKGKVMLEVFFDAQGFIYHKLISEEHAVKKECKSNSSITSGIR
jgi:hypothetical protein